MWIIIIIRLVSRPPWNYYASAKRSCFFPHFSFSRSFARCLGLRVRVHNDCYCRAARVRQFVSDRIRVLYTRLYNVSVCYYFTVRTRVKSTRCVFTDHPRILETGRQYQKWTLQKSTGKKIYILTKFPQFERYIMAFARYWRMSVSYFIKTVRNVV